MEITLEALGLSQAQIQDRVIELVVDRLLSSTGYDEYGDEVDEPSKFEKAMKDRIKRRVDQSIDEIAGQHVIPNVDNFLINFVIQKTNDWGEAKGEPVTFVEYIAERAEAYMREKVDGNGKSRSEAGGYSWSGKQERLTYLIDNKLQFAISTALKGSLKTVQESIGESVAETIRAQLKQITTDIKVAVK